MKVEVRVRGDAVSAVDDTGSPVMATLGEVKNYGRGNQVYLPRQWTGKRVCILELSSVE